MSGQSPYPPEFVKDVTISVNRLIESLNALDPKLREAGLMSAIMSLTDGLLKTSKRDPSMSYLMLLTAMGEVYESVFNKKAPDRILQ